MFISVLNVEPLYVIVYDVIVFSNNSSKIIIDLYSAVRW